MRVHTYAGSLGIGAVIVATMPTAASVLGVDGLRGWLHLTPAWSGVVRAALLVFVGWAATHSLARGRAESAVTTMAAGLAAGLVLTALAAGVAAMWSSPSGAADVQEWALLYAVPVAGAAGAVAGVAVLVMDLGTTASSDAAGLPLATAAWMGGLAIIAYSTLRAAGVVGVPRIAIPLGIGATVFVVLGGAALDNHRARWVRGVTGALAGGVVLVLSLL